VVLQLVILGGSSVVLSPLGSGGVVSLSSESYSLVVLICVKERYYLGGNQGCLVWSKKARLPSFVLPAGCLLRAAVLVLGVNNTVLEELWFM